MDPVEVTGRGELPFTGQIGLGAWPGIDALAVEASRRQDLVLPHLVKVRQRYRFRLPAGARLHLPDTPAVRDCGRSCVHKDQTRSPFGVFERALVFEKNELIVDLNFTLAKTVIPRDMYATFRDWLAKVRETRAERVEVRYAE